MRIFNRKHIPWFLFVCLATAAAAALYIANFYPEWLPEDRRLPPFFGETPPSHQTIGGTPLGLIFGAISFAIFIFAALLGLRKKIPLWRVGTVERWLRAHIWLTLLTIPLVLLHCGFHFGGPMTTLLIALYAIVMLSGIYGLALQHQMPRLMKDRLPAETVFEQIPFIREQLAAAAVKMRDSFKPAPAAKPGAVAPATSAAKKTTAGNAPMVSTAPELSTPSARAKTAVGSTVIAATVSAPGAAANELTEERPVRPAPPPVDEAEPDVMPPKPATVPQATVPETGGTPTARVPAEVAPPAEADAGVVKTVPPANSPPAPNETNPAPSSTTTDATAAKVMAPTRPKPETVVEPKAAPKTVPAPKAAPTKAAPAKPAKAPTPEPSPASEALLVELIEQQILPFLQARRADRHPLANPRFSDDTFRFVKLRVAEAYRPRVEEIQGWCDERRMLGRQARMHHWLHGWLFVHVPLSFLLILLTAWHAFVTLFRY
jgi:hypothetical protein